MKLILSFAIVVLSACSTAKVVQTPPPATPAQPVNTVTTIQTKPMHEISWNGPCTKPNPLSGFNLEVMDPNKKLLAKKFIPVKKDDEYGCKPYSFEFKNGLPKSLVRTMRIGKFKGWFNVRSVATNKMESGNASIEVR